ncbi:EamA family transporter [Propylenella binzhouense]|uniref:EamA family transporter n=1 Tax=Propylenella binzhouense TaxID=2555902 RepID=A0A964WVL0_9HYPH|nr:EamA family transporter [Propylenella binzhouense]MYZ50347.1 EamA family transporter [Propylenella binzhouense]
MRSRHVALAFGIALVWGLNFVVIRIGLDSLPPILMAGLRFVLAGLPAFLVPRPAVPWPRFAAIAATLFVGQFALLFSGMAAGMPPGLASITLQVQVFMTVLIAAFVLGELPLPRQIAGSAVALAGLGLIAATAGGAGVTSAGLLLTLAAALSWASGNVLLRRAGAMDMFAAMSWLSVAAAPPLLLLSLVVEGPAAIAAALSRLDPAGAGALLYVAFLSTTLGYAGWGHLLKLYPAATVTPFAFLVPVVAILSAALLLGERFGPMRLAGMALILAGVVPVVMPLRPGRRRRAR